MNRDLLLKQAVARHVPWDIIVIGGGATGAGIALDAVTRGYSCLLVERFDFGNGTSSRSTKLVHGGVRYLKQGYIPLVFEALHERGRLLRNAPHIVHDLPFVIPAFGRLDRPKYGIGMTLYDLLATGSSFGRSRMLNVTQTRKRLPTVRTDGLRGGVEYHDGQFDDARLLIDLIATGVRHGVVAINYAPVIGLERNTAGRVTGIRYCDAETKVEHRAAARVVINATGVFCDGVRRLADAQAAPLVAPSQGTHLVFAGSFLPGGCALMVPDTSDGRVLFAIPWHGHTLVGTTDVALPEVTTEPHATATEIDFILRTAGRYITPAPTRADVLSVFVGIRPLVQRQPGAHTAALSREHVIHVDADGLLTITGGKWTTYRRMAEDAIDRAAALGGLPGRRCRTKSLPIRGTNANAGQRLHSDLPYTTGDVVTAVRHEMARTVEDVSARRTRSLFLNARAAMAVAQQVAGLMSRELGHDGKWCELQCRAFAQLAAGYQ